MSVVLRRVDHRRFWDKDRNAEEGWLHPDDVRADALWDLKTEQNALSVYLLDSKDEGLINRFVAALAAIRQRVVHFDYALVDLESFRTLGLALADAPGVTPDSTVNGWHKNVIELTAEKVAKVAAHIQGSGEFGRVQAKDVGRLIRRSLDANLLDVGLVDGSVREEVQNARYRN